MYKGTLIDELMRAVERAEERARDAYQIGRAHV